MTAAHLCEHENWPGHGPEPSGRRPTPYLLALLAAVYGCAVTDLIDLDDREHLPPADLLILDKFSHGQPGANRTAVTEAPSRQGRVWNPTTGCDKISPGCGLPRFEGDATGGCYAIAMGPAPQSNGSTEVPGGRGPA